MAERVEDCESVPTASSSGLDDGDVTVICQEEKLEHKIEEQLAKRYDVVDCFIGGREKIKNLMSKTKHSRARIVIINHPRRGTFENDLAPLFGGHHLPFGSTLILHDPSVKKSDIHPYLKKFQLLRLATRLEDMVEQISLYIEALKVSDIQAESNDVETSNKLFALLLICTSSAIRGNISVPYLEVKRRFEQANGSFQNLQVGKLKRFLVDHKMGTIFGTGNLQISLTSEGLRFVDICINRFESHSNQRATISFPDTPDQQAVSKNIKSTSYVPLNLPETQSEVGKWAATSNSSVTCKEIHYEKGQNEFYGKLHNLDPNYALFLIASKLKYCDELQRLSQLPLLKVFDFDPDSRDKGLLNSVESMIVEKRNLTISTLDDTGESITDGATHWVFMKGFREKADTIFKQGAYQWGVKCDKALQENCQHMLEYCMLEKPAVFLILWYDEKEVGFLKWFLYQVQKAFSNDSNKLPWEIVLCIPDEPLPESDFTEVINCFDITDGLTVLDERSVVNWLGKIQQQQPKIQHNISGLPKRNEDGTTSETFVPKQKLPWLNALLEFLPFSAPETEGKENLGEKFLRGGLLEWEDLRSGDIAVQRVVHQDVCDFIQKEAIEKCKSIIMRIMHTPGGGGTTFARQVLWSLRTSAPCCVLATSTYFPLNGIIERIGEIHKLTQLPVVILVDGRSEDVQRLFRSRKYAVVIIHVQRNTSAGFKKTSFRKMDCCYLEGKVNRDEARSLTTLFSKFSITEQSKQALESIRDDVLEGRELREVFEFGLATFADEFKGVRKYVEGYMGNMTFERQYWQQIITYLSLLHFYGQEGMFPEVFRSLIPDCKDFVSIDQVQKGNKFIIEKERKWKINYNAVAREVLELALGQEGPTTEQEAGKLSAKAKRNLHELVIEFVRYIKKAVGNTHLNKVQNILLHLSTTRNYKDTDNMDHLAEKNILSPLLEDIYSVEDRILVMQEFTVAFPKFAEFHAHLGRLCSVSCRFEKAEESLNTALNLRIRQLEKRNANVMDDTLGRYHHMFGYAFLRKVKDSARKINKKDALAAAEKGVEHFEQGRRYAVYNRIYGYVGEVRVRLLIVKMFVEKYKGVEKAFSGEVGCDDHVLSQFVQDSHSVCDQLLFECQNFSKQLDLSRNNLYSTCVFEFNHYFKGLEIPLDLNHIDYTSLPLIRSRISSIKMKHQVGKGISLLEEIKNKKDINEVVNILDKAISSVLSKDSCHAYIGFEMQQWLDAIRNKFISDNYALVRVSQRLELWNKRNEFGFSTFYLYVVYILLAMYSSGEKQRGQYWKQAKDLLKKLKYSRDEHLIKGKELLANHSGLTIRKLISRRHMGGWDNEQKTWKSKEGIAKLQVCTGTILKSDRPLTGYISVDLKNPIPHCPIEIFFSPKKHNLHGSLYAQRSTRVEFFIAFNTNGAEAESIRKLEKRRCSMCGYDTEVITLNEPERGRCGQCDYAYA